MSQAQRRFWMVILFLYCIACIWLLSQYELALDGEGMTHAMRETMKSNILFSFVVITVGALRLHPRFGTLHQSLRRTANFIVFLVFLFGSPLVVWTLTPALPKTGRDILMALCLCMCITVYSMNYIIFPEVVRRKNYALAHRMLDIAQRLLPWNAHFYITRALLYTYEFKFENTINTINRALALISPVKRKEEQSEFQIYDWRLITAHTLRMSAYFALDQQEMAFEDAEILVRLNPDDAIAYINRATASAQRDDFAAAEADLDHASQLKLDSRHQVFLTTTRANLAYMQHKNEEARSLFQAALEIPINTQQRNALHPIIYDTLGLIELREGHIEAAREFCQKAQSMNPDFKALAIALIHAQKGEWDEAVKQWQLIIAKTPHYGKIESVRRVYRSDPPFMALIEQIIVHLEPVAA